MKRQLALLAAIFLLAPVGAATAQDNNGDQTVKRQLDAILDSRSREVFRKVGRMPSAEQHGYLYNLPVGSFEARGACDTDCDDLDVVVIDMDNGGKEVARDDLDDDVPIVSFRVSKAGRFQFQLWMAKCSAAPCSYGLSVVQK